MGKGNDDEQNRESSELEMKKKLMESTQSSKKVSKKVEDSEATRHKREERLSGPLCKNGSFYAPPTEEDDGPIGPFKADGSFVSNEARAPPKPKQGPLMKDGSFKTASDSDLAKMRIRDDILDNQRAPPLLEDLPFLSAPLLAAGKEEVESAPAVSANVIRAPSKRLLQSMGLPTKFGPPQLAQKLEEEEPEK